MNDSGTGSTVRELTAWGSLIIMCSLFSWYASKVVADPTSVIGAFGLIALMLGYIIVSNIFLSIFVSFASPKEKDDERDKEIIARSSRYSEYVLGAGAIVTVFLIFSQQASWLGVYDIAYDPDASADAIAEIPGKVRDIRDDLWRHPIVSGHLLLATVVLADIVRSLTICIDYRRSS